MTITKPLIVVICVHCKAVLNCIDSDLPNAEELSISHSDCLGYNERPCEAGRQYHFNLAKQLGFKTFTEYLNSFKR